MENRELADELLEIGKQLIALGDKLQPVPQEENEYQKMIKAALLFLMLRGDSSVWKRKGKGKPYITVGILTDLIEKKILGFTIPTQKVGSESRKLGVKISRRYSDGFRIYFYQPYLQKILNDFEKDVLDAETLSFLADLIRASNGTN